MGGFWMSKCTFAVSWLLLSALWVPFVAASDTPPVLEISAATIRQLPPGQSVTSAYMVLSNRSEVPCTLVGAAIDIAKRVEFHRHAQVDGMMQMRRVEQLVVAPGQDVRFHPGGLHLMVFDPDWASLEKRSAQLTLRTLECGDFTTEAALRRLVNKSSGWGRK